MRVRMTGRTLTPAERRRARRKGAALVLVMVFSIGALMLVSTLIAMGDASLKSETARHLNKNLTLVSKAGIAAAINEINRSRLEGAYDPDNDGVGALLTGFDGLEGIPITSAGVNVDVDGDSTLNMGNVSGPDGVLLGRFRATIDTTTYPNRTVLVVVSVYPAFKPADAGFLGIITDTQGTSSPSDDVRRIATDAEWQDIVQVASAELELKAKRPPFPANALSLTGGTSNGGAAGFQVTGNPQITMTDASVEVPAVNITDPASYAQFSNEILNNYGSNDQISGLNPETGTTSADDAPGETVTNDEAGVINDTTLDLIADGIDQRVLDATGDPLNLVTATSGVLVDANGDGYHVINGPLVIDGTLSGSGTLVINGSVEIGSGDTLDWNGQIIVADDAAGNASLLVKGDLNVNGVMSILNRTNEGETRFELDNGGRMNVTGAFVSITSDTGATGGSNLGVVIESGSRFFVDGICAFLGEAINIAFDAGGGAIEITGSMVVSCPPTAETGLSQFLIKPPGITFAFDSNNFNDGLDELGEFFDPEGNKLPIQVSAYWEQGGRAVLKTQQTKVDAGGALGMP